MPSMSVNMSISLSMLPSGKLTVCDIDNGDLVRGFTH